MNDGYQEVLNHLLFHKALEEDAPDKIDRYVRLLERVQEGAELEGEDRFERSVAAAFQLVLEASFDPWDIDLVRFSQAYLDRLRRLGTVNFVSAGRVVLLAWSVLKLQSERVLADVDPTNPPPEDLLDAWDLDLDLYEAPQEVEFTHRVLGREEPPLQEALLREGVRPVTLVDLLDAFAQAFDQAAQGRAPAPHPQRRRREALRGKVHKEDLEEDLRRTWERIRAQGAEVVALGDLCNGDRWERATLFLSVLFLARVGWLEVWQEDFPWGEIYLRPQAAGEGALPSMEAALAPAEVA